MNELETLQLPTTEAAPTFLAAMGAVVLLIRCYRSRVVQALLPDKASWDNLPQGVRFAIVFVASLCTSWAAGAASGQSTTASLMAALPVAAGAVATHKTTRAVGYAHTKRKLKSEGGDYRPGTIRTSLGFVLPVDQKSIRKTRDASFADAQRERESNGLV